MTTSGFEVRKVKAINPITSGAAWVVLEGDIDAQPGQFVMVWLPNISEKPFSIASMNPFCLLVMDVGPLSHALHQLKVGDLIWIKGPLGRGFTVDGECLLLVGGGYGSAPLLPLAKLAKAGDKKVTVCLGANNGDSILLADAFIDLGCKVNVATEDGSLGIQGLVTLLAENAIRNSKFDIVCACGPVGMLSALAAMCNVNRLNYQLSWEAHMRCGMGLCGSCEVPASYDPSLPPGWLACYDGPVFYQKWNQDQGLEET